MVVNPEQAIIIKTIFELFLQGYGATKIKYELERRGYPTATGKKTWSTSAILRTLSNDFYCGTIVYRKFYIPEFLE